MAGPTREHTITAPTDDPIHDVDAVWEQCREPDWDGQGAMPVEAETVENAKAVLDSLPTAYPPPSVGVEADGSLTFEWYRDPQWLLSVSVNRNRALHYAARFGTSTVRGHETFSGELPEIILHCIRRVHPS